MLPLCFLAVSCHDTIVPFAVMTLRSCRNIAAAEANPRWRNSLKECERGLGRSDPSTPQMGSLRCPTATLRMTVSSDFAGGHAIIIEEIRKAARRRPVGLIAWQLSLLLLVRRFPASGHRRYDRCRCHCRSASTMRLAG